jgi:diacylglycerol kinase family enzyme
VRKFFAARRDAPTLTVELPGKTPVDGVYYAMVSNSSPWTFLNSRPVVTNPGTSFDCGLGVFAMRGMGVLGTLRTARQLLSDSGGPASPLLLRTDDVAHVRLRSNGPIGVQLDGDYVGTREIVDFAAVPAALEVVAPKLR